MQGFALELNLLGDSEVCVFMNLSAEPARRQRQAGFLMQQAEIVTPPAADNTLRPSMF
jgi:hypothetical protein